MGEMAWGFLCCAEGHCLCRRAQWSKAAPMSTAAACDGWRLTAARWRCHRCSSGVAKLAGVVAIARRWSPRLIGGCCRYMPLVARDVTAVCCCSLEMSLSYVVACWRCHHRSPEVVAARCLRCLARTVACLYGLRVPTGLAMWHTPIVPHQPRFPRRCTVRGCHMASSSKATST